MSRKKLQVPLNFKGEPPIIDTSNLKNVTITQQEFESFWKLLKLHVKHSETQLRMINIVNMAITTIFCVFLFLSALNIIGHAAIITALLIGHIAVYLLLLHLALKQNMKKRTAFLERENKKTWKARGLRWSIEKATAKSLEEMLVLSEDNEISLRLNESEDEYKPEADECKLQANDSSMQFYGTMETNPSV